MIHSGVVGAQVLMQLCCTIHCTVGAGTNLTIWRYEDQFPSLGSYSSAVMTFCADLVQVAWTQGAESVQKYQR